MAAVLTLVQTKQIRIEILKPNNTKSTVQTIQNTVNASTHITKTPTHYKTHTYTHTHITKPTHTHTPTHYKTHTYTHTHTLKNPHIHTPTHYKTISNNHSTRYTRNEIVTIQSSGFSIRSP
jgi:hypothetical protein